MIQCLVFSKAFFMKPLSKLLSKDNVAGLLTAATIAFQPAAALPMHDAQTLDSHSMQEERIIRKVVQPKARDLLLPFSTSLPLQMDPITESPSTTIVRNVLLPFTPLQLSDASNVRTDLRPESSINEVESGSVLGSTTEAGFLQPFTPKPIKPLGAPKPLRDLAEQENSYMRIYEQSIPGVVYISTFVSARDAYSMNILEIPAGTGSGFVWDKKGHIVTNFHVIRSSSTAEIRLTDPASPGGSKQVTYIAKVEGYDPDHDVAVLKIDAPAEKLSPIDVGSSGSLRVGMLALAIGNPFGLDHTLTTGVISGLNREVRSPSGVPISNVIQTDAAINPGNSGGPLLNSAGEIVGMNTAIYSPSGASAGIGFAIPIDTLKVIVDSIIETGSVVRPVIGITFLPSAQAKALGILNGVLVLDVPAGSNAEIAGLRGTSRTGAGSIDLGDIIIAVDDTQVYSEGDMFRALEKKKPGDFVKVKIVRIMSTGEQEQKVLKVKLQASTPKNVMLPVAP